MVVSSAKPGDTEATNEHFPQSRFTAAQSQDSLRSSTAHFQAPPSSPAFAGFVSSGTPTTDLKLLGFGVIILEFHPTWRSIKTPTPFGRCRSSFNFGA
ncbi:hypothetical protein D9757_014213 [Collybiopsis confluens]|uniref:Uncharacterized protein n=1 Tax=Collybiopsis confluens TaxID=2823264 RepID=A0A8H5FQA3_9AGAR|nr:hypothetical protein D9757_014213 [Collybiopsis confluens]